VWLVPHQLESELLMAEKHNMKFIGGGCTHTRKAGTYSISKQISWMQMQSGLG